MNHTNMSYGPMAVWKNRSHGLPRQFSGRSPTHADRKFEQDGSQLLNAVANRVLGFGLVGSGSGFSRVQVQVLSP